MAYFNEKLNREAVSSTSGLDMELVMINIFSSCDTDNSDLVKVSKLINFVKPYLEGNSEELSELVRELDPDGIDPCISSEHFFNVMNQWVSKIKKNNLIGDPRRNSENFENQSLPFVNSTPKADFGGNSDCNTERFLEQIKELDFQNQKLSQELYELRICANILEEKNETLLIDLTKLSGKLASEQQMTDRLRAFVKENEDVQESLTVSITKIQVFQNALLNSEKHISDLQEIIRNFENEKQNVDSQVSKLAENEKEAMRAVDELHSQLCLRDTDINQLKEENSKLNNRMSELEMLVEDYKICNESLKSDIRNQENCFVSGINQDLIVQNSGNSSPPLNNNQQLCNASVMHNVTNEDDLIWISKMLTPITPLSSESSLQSELLKADANSNTILDTAMVVPSNLKELQEKVYTLETEIESKNENINFLHSLNVQLKEKLQSSAPYITEERVKLTDLTDTDLKHQLLNERITILEEENNQKSVKLTELNIRFETVAKNYAQTQAKFESSKEETELLKLEIEMTKLDQGSYDTITHHLKTLQDENESLLSRLEFAKSNEDAMTKQFENVAVENLTLKSEMDSQEFDKDKLQSEKEKIFRQLNHFKFELEQKSLLVIEKEAKFNEERLQYRSSLEQLELSHQDQVNQYKQQIKTYLLEMNELHNKIKLNNDKISDLNSLVKHLDVAIKQREREVQDLQDFNIILSEKLKEEEERNKIASKKLEVLRKLKKYNSDLEMELTNFQAEREEWVKKQQKDLNVASELSEKLKLAKAEATCVNQQLQMYQDLLDTFENYKREYNLLKIERDVLAEEKENWNKVKEKLISKFISSIYEVNCLQQQLFENDKWESLITNKQQHLQHIEEKCRKKETGRIFQKVDGVKRKFQETIDELINFTQNHDSNPVSSDEMRNKFSKNDQFNRTLCRTKTNLEVDDPNSDKIRTVVRNDQKYNLKGNGDGAQVYNVPTDNVQLIPPISLAAVSDPFLDALELEKKQSTLSEKEMEHAVTTLVLSFTIDASSVKKRYQEQDKRKMETEHVLNIELQNLMVFLEQAITNECPMEFLINARKQLESINRACANALTSASQFGVVHQEYRLIQPISLIINYLAFQKRKLDNVTIKFEHIKNELYANKGQYKTKPNPHFQQITDNRDDLISEVSRVPSLHLRKSIMDRIQEAYEKAKSDDGLFREIFVCGAIFCFTLSIIAFGESILEYVYNQCNSKSCWNDAFIPFMIKEYPNGPPPI